MPPASRSILVGGLTGFGLSIMLAWIPVVGPVMCCAALFGTGLMAVWHRVAVGARVSSGEGVKLGAQAGLVAFVASTLTVFVSWLAAGRPNLASQLRALQERDLGELDPTVLELGARALDDPRVVMGLVLGWVCLYALFGLLGGAIGAGVFNRVSDGSRRPRS